MHALLSDSESIVSALLNVVFKLAIEAEIRASAYSQEPNMPDALRRRPFAPSRLPAAIAASVRFVFGNHQQGFLNFHFLNEIKFSHFFSLNTSASSWMT